MTDAPTTDVIVTPVAVKRTQKDWAASVMLLKADELQLIERTLNQINPATPSDALRIGKEAFQTWKANLYACAQGKIYSSMPEWTDAIYTPGHTAILQLQVAPEITSLPGGGMKHVTDGLQDRFMMALASLSTSLRALERVISRTHGTSTTHTGPGRG